jgi:hypothetical protein
MEVGLSDDMNPGEVGFVLSRFPINEGSTNGYVQIRLWRTLDTPKVGRRHLSAERPVRRAGGLGPSGREPWFGREWYPVARCSKWSAVTFAP